VTSPARSRWIDLTWLLAGRVGFFAAVLAAAVGFVLVLLLAAPGDAIDMQTNSEEMRPVLAAEWHLDRPIAERWAWAVFDAARGDLGTSLTYRPGKPVAEVIAGPARRSLVWLVSALVLSVAWGTLLAWFTAGRPTVTRRVTQAISIIPVFLLAHLVVNSLNELAFSAMNAGWIARPAWFALPDQPSALRTALAVVLLAVGSGALSDVHAEVEDALVRIRGSGYVDAALARGAPTWPHVAMNLVPPLATIVTHRAPFFVGGLVILEKVLLLNGMGYVLWEAALKRDYNLAVGITLFTAAFVCLARLVGDTIRLAVDPRLRTGTR
jgi:ABC-type dipeptide/oligopeptide/nickel transport system permease component